MIGIMGERTQRVEKSERDEELHRKKRMYSFLFLIIKGKPLSGAAGPLPKFLLHFASEYFKLIILFAIYHKETKAQSDFFFFFSFL